MNNSHFPNNKWFEFGLSLGLDEPTLDEIRAEFGTSVSSCLRECLTKWLNEEDRVNYDSLADALRKIGEKAVADSISKLLKHSIRPVPDFGDMSLPFELSNSM